MFFFPLRMAESSLWGAGPWGPAHGEMLNIVASWWRCDGGVDRGLVPEVQVCLVMLPGSKVINLRSREQGKEVLVRIE